MLFCKPNCLYLFYLQDIMALFWREWMTGCHSSPLTIGLASEEGEDDSPIFLAVNVFKSFFSFLYLTRHYLLFSNIVFGKYFYVIVVK